MIEFVQWSATQVSDWEIGVFASIEWTRQRARVVLSNGDGTSVPLATKIALLQEQEKTGRITEMLEILYQQEFVENAMQALDSRVLTADFSWKRSPENPYGKLFWLIPHQKSWKNQLPNTPSILEKGGVRFYNPFVFWKTHGKLLSKLYPAYRAFQEKDEKIWNALKSELRAWWKVPRRNIPQWKIENVADHTNRWMNLILRYKEDILEELQCNWLEISRIISMFRIHDYPEAYIELWDIADSDKSVSPEDKARRTKEAARIIFWRFWKDWEKLLNLWIEAEECRTPSWRMVKEIDKIQAAEQALFYESQGWNCFVEFYEGVIKRWFVTFNTTKQIMLDLWRRYIGYLETEWKSEEIVNFLPIIERIQNIQIPLSKKALSLEA